MSPLDQPLESVLILHPYFLELRKGKIKSARHPAKEICMAVRNLIFSRKLSNDECLKVLLSEGFMFPLCLGK